MEKYKNNFEGFVKIFNDESIRPYFKEWILESGFGNKFTPQFDVESHLLKVDKNIVMQYGLSFNINYELKKIDLNYICDLIKDIIPYEEVESNIAVSNVENEGNFFQRHTTPKYHNEIIFNIPFNIIN